MFQNLRAGTPLYILHKSEPRIEIGEVISVSNPQAQFGAATYQAGIPYQPQKMVVDVKIKVGDTTIDLQQLPADAVIADFSNNSMVISENRDAILNEVTTLAKNSEKILESVDYHKNVVERCATIVTDLNPHIRQEAEQRKEIERVKSELSGLRDDMSDIRAMLAKALNKKSKED
ncbi:MAG: hypothetical protein NC346_02470 [Prevotella sp.]|nr:hypothetical protein [Bacteroidales bacterium]MCM1068738.1 hypothetical protein [Prevotella sp.]MCM1577163.1 hypothetical protein [Bacteroides sp.]